MTEPVVNITENCMFFFLNTACQSDGNTHDMLHCICAYDYDNVRYIQKQQKPMRGINTIKKIRYL